MNKIGAKFLPFMLISGLGCGQKGSETYPVHGKVVLEDGSAVTAGFIEFEAMEGPWRGRNARGAIQPDGSFRLSTKGLGDGAVAGLHRAIVRSPYPTASQAEQSDFGVDQIDPRFGTYGESGLEFRVEEKDNSFEIEVARYQRQ